MKLSKLATKAVKAVKRNPELVLAIGGLLAPKLIAKAAPVIVAMGAPREGSDR